MVLHSSPAEGPEECSKNILAFEHFSYPKRRATNCEAPQRPPWTPRRRCHAGLRCPTGAFPTQGGRVFPFQHASKSLMCGSLQPQAKLGTLKAQVEGFAQLWHLLVAIWRLRSEGSSLEILVGLLAQTTRRLGRGRRVLASALDGHLSGPRKHILGSTRVR